MKKILSITAIFVMFLVGCSNQDNNVTGPTNGINELSKELAVATSASEPIVSVSQLIDGVVGGWVRLSNEYIDPAGRLMKVDAALFFPQGSFNGTENITMTADFTNASVLFTPHMQFNKSVSLTVQYLGLPLGEKGYSSNCKVDFVYFGEDGNIYPIGSKGISRGRYSL